MSGPAAVDFVVGAEDAGQTLAAILKRREHAATWNEAKRVVSTGKVFVDGKVVPDPTLRPKLGARIEIRPRERRYEPPPEGKIVYEDPQVVVFEKPSGVSSVPYETRETGTAMDLIRAHWRAVGRKATETPLHIVHRIDKETSGLICFAKTKEAEKVLAARFRLHEIERTYICVAHGQVPSRRIESRFVDDRGDGLRGSAKDPRQHGKRAVTHVKPIELIGTRATLCEVRLETGKTHQIRIHLSEAGHPLVGEKVYIRDWLKQGREDELLPSPRLLLHAATLGFEPITDKPGAPELRFESPLPAEFTKAVAALRKL